MTKEEFEELSDEKKEEMTRRQREMAEQMDSVMARARLRGYASGSTTGSRPRATIRGPVKDRRPAARTFSCAASVPTPQAHW